MYILFQLAAACATVFVPDPPISSRTALIIPLMTGPAAGEVVRQPFEYRSLLQPDLYAQRVAATDPVLIRPGSLLSRHAPNVPSHF
jgi:hypothetical protein